MALWMCGDVSSSAHAYMWRSVVDIVSLLIGSPLFLKFLQQDKSLI